MVYSEWRKLALWNKTERVNVGRQFIENLYSPETGCERK